MDLEAIKNRIDNIVKITIEKGILIKLRDETIENITYSEEDKQWLLNPNRYLDDVIFRNYDRDYCLPLFEYNRLLDELNKFESYHLLYGKALFEFFKLKENIDLKEPIYYGYINDFIENKMKELGEHHE